MSVRLLVTLAGIMFAWMALGHTARGEIFGHIDVPSLNEEFQKSADIPVNGGLNENMGEDIYEEDVTLILRRAVGPIAQTQPVYAQIVVETDDDGDLIGSFDSPDGGWPVGDADVELWFNGIKYKSRRIQIVN